MKESGWTFDNSFLRDVEAYVTREAEVWPRIDCRDYHVRIDNKFRAFYRYLPFLTALIGFTWLRLDTLQTDDFPVFY